MLPCRILHASKQSCERTTSLFEVGEKEAEHMRNEPRKSADAVRPRATVARRCSVSRQPGDMNHRFVGETTTPCPHASVCPRAAARPRRVGHVRTLPARDIPSATSVFAALATSARTAQTVSYTHLALPRTRARRPRSGLIRKYSPRPPSSTTTPWQAVSAKWPS